MPPDTSERPEGSTEFTVGQLIGQDGRYRITDRIGNTKMSVVFGAEDRGLLGCRVVVKQLANPADQGAQDRFRVEFHALCQVRHLRRSVKILGRGDDFLVLEHVAGQTLSQFISGSGGRGLDPKIAIEIVAQIARALAESHAVGIVHRDLKPDNIIVGEEDGVFWCVILDYGIAIVGAANNLTQGAIGTPSYMAPEQCSGAKDVGPKADVYALGVVLFEMLTGAPPFAGEQGWVFQQHLTVPVRDGPLKKRCGHELVDLALAMLAKGPAQRIEMRDVIACADRLREAPRSHLLAAFDDRTSTAPSTAVAGDVTPTGGAGELVAADDLPRRRLPQEVPIVQLPEVSGRKVERRVAGLFRQRSFLIISGLAAVGLAAFALRGWYPRQAGGSQATLTALGAPLKSSAEPVALTSREAVVVLPAGAEECAAHPDPEMTCFSARRFTQGNDAAGIEEQCRLLGADCTEDWEDTDGKHDGSHGKLYRQLGLRSVLLWTFNLDRREYTCGRLAAKLNALGIVPILEKEGRKRADGRGVNPPQLRYVYVDDVLVYDLFGDTACIEYDAGRAKYRVKKSLTDVPIDKVSQIGAEKLCEAEGKTLPTAAQLEAAARGLTYRLYAFGDEAPTCDGVTFDQVEDGRHQPACPPASREGVGARPVCSSKQDISAEGVCDLAGNVSEWTMDKFTRGYDACNGGPCINPRVAPAAPSDAMEVRGGNWASDRLFMFATSRSRQAGNRPFENIGFRCARTSTRRPE